MLLDFVLQLVVSGLIMGSAYALVALGLTIIYGMMHVVNMAHGELYMIGGFLVYTFVTVLHLNFFLGIFLALGGTLILAAIMERLLIRRVVGAPIINSTLLTIGLSITLKNAAQVVWGPLPKAVATPFGFKPIRVGFLMITPLQLFILAVTVAAIVFSHVAIKKTKLGKAMRATFQDREAAILNGIDVSRIYTATFLYGSVLASLAGILLGPIFSIYPEMGSAASLKAWAIVMVGGLGNFPGAIVGGLLLGVVESLGAGLISSGYAEAIAFAAVVVVLLVKPAGIFGGRRAL